MTLPPDTLSGAPSPFEVALCLAPPLGIGAWFTWRLVVAIARDWRR